MLSALTDLKNSNYLILSELLEMELKLGSTTPFQPEELIIIYMFSCVMFKTV